jgi:alpha-beta hydrolase superfamily lysophospholipase
MLTAGFLKSTRALTGRMEDTVPELSLPLLVVLAREDVVVDNEKIKEEFFATYPGCKALVELDGPHYVDFSAARDSFREAVRAWLLDEGPSEKKPSPQARASR